MHTTNTMKHPSLPRFHSALRVPKQQQGFTLIETLVAMLIFVVGILGLVGLQTGVTLAQTEARARSEAAFLAQEMIGLMWTDITKLDQYTILEGAECSAPACQQWLGKVRATLPRGSAILATTQITDGQGATIGSNVDLSLTWQTPNENQRRYVTSTAIIRRSPA